MLFLEVLRLKFLYIIFIYNVYVSPFRYRNNILNSILSNKVQRNVSLSMQYQEGVSMRLTFILFYLIICNTYIYILNKLAYKGKYNKYVHLINGCIVTIWLELSTIIWWVIVVILSIICSFWWLYPERPKFNGPNPLLCITFPFEYLKCIFY